MNPQREPLNRLILAAEYLLDGRSISWVAREFGYSTLQMSHLTGILGLQGRRSSPGPALLEVYDKVEEALLEQWPISEITRTFGVARGTVNRWFPDRPKMTAVESGELAQLYKENREARKRARVRGSWADMFEKEE